MLFTKILFSVVAPHNAGKRFMRQAVRHLLMPHQVRELKVRELIKDEEFVHRVSQKLYVADEPVVCRVLENIDFDNPTPIILESLRTAAQVEAVYTALLEHGWTVATFYRDLPRSTILARQDRTTHDAATILRSLAEWDRHEDQLLPALVRMTTPGYFFNLEEEWYETPGQMAEFLRDTLHRRQPPIAA